VKTLVQLNGISKRYGSAALFHNCNAAVASCDKIGVIGRNGAGKTTLLKIITGEEEPDSGTVERSRDLALGYLEQCSPFKPGETVLEFLVRSTNREEWKCGKIAGRFRIKNRLLTATPIGDLSGGYQTRVKLTAVLLGEPNVLLLDEPSNFLDLNTLILLEKFLQDYAGAFLIVSHDREFLKKTCRKTLEIENGRITLFPGTVEEYFAWKEDVVEQKTRFNRNVEAKQKQLETFITRFRAKATKARQAQSKLKQLKKLEKIEIEHPVGTARIAIPPIEKRKGYALKCSGLAIGYTEKPVAEDINLHIERGAHIAVLGDNGQGKTTFLRTLAGALAPKEGEFRWSKHAEIAYYEQNVYENLDPAEDVYSFLQKAAGDGLFRQDILNMAGCFLFSGDDVMKPVRVLSGGERARLCLAGLLLSKKPVLLLDEPTNHLDFETVEALGAALREYNGTVMFVSHDRTFVNMVTTGIVDVKNGRIVHYPGTYEDYVYHLDRLAAEASSGDGASREKSGKTAGKKTAYRRRKELNSEINKLKAQSVKLEQQIETYEMEKQAIIRIFSLKPEDYSTGQNQRLDELTGLIEADEKIWFDILEKIEQLKSRIP